MGSKSKRNRKSRKEERRYTVRGIRRNPPDIRKLSRALISLAMAEAEREAQAQHQAEADKRPDATGDGGPVDE